MFKKWILLFALVFLGLTCAIGFFNYKADPFGYWGTRRGEYDKVSTYTKATFERHVKVNYISRNPEKYSAVIFGGSNATALNPELATELTGNKTYNFSAFNGNSTDYLQLVEFCIETMPNLKEIIIQLSNQEVNTVEKVVGNKLPAYITGGSEFLEMFSFIFIKPLESYSLLMKRLAQKTQTLSTKLFVPSENQHPLFDRGYTEDGKLEVFYENLSDDERIELIFYDKEAEFIPALKILFTEDERNFRDGNLCIENVKKIKSLCDKSGIKLTLFIGAAFISKKMYLEGEQYYSWLRSLAKVTDFYDFSGFYDANLNPFNFYNAMHYDYETADEILKIVLGGKQNPAFGEHLSAQNIDQAISRRRTAFEALKAEYEMTGTVHLFDKAHESYFRREGK